jgi:exosome complex component RRP46
MTLQVTTTPFGGASVRRKQCIAILPALLQASILALLSTSIPLVDVYTTTIITADSEGNLELLPTPEDIEVAQSVHVLAFSSHDTLLVAESEGLFDIDLWDAVHAKALHACRGVFKKDDRPGVMDMDINVESSLEATLRAAVGAKIAKDQRWKAGTG